MQTILIDTSFLFALINPADKNHAACAAVARDVQARRLIPVTVLPEIAYLLDQRLGHQVLRAFVQELKRAVWEIEPLHEDDFARCDELLNAYADNRIDFVDTTLVAMAERLDIETIMTLDRRHFGVVRPKHAEHFQLLP